MKIIWNPTFRLTIDISMKYPENFAELVEELRLLKGQSQLISISNVLTSISHLDLQNESLFLSLMSLVARRNRFMSLQMCTMVKFDCEEVICLYLPLSVAAQITVQHQQGANIAIAIRSPSTQNPSHGNAILYIYIFIHCSGTCFSSLSRLWAPISHVR